MRSLSASEDKNCSDDRSIAIEFDKPPSPHGAPVRHSQIQHDLSELRALAAMALVRSVDQESKRLAAFLW